MAEERGYIFDIQKFCLHDGAGIRTDVFFCGCNLHCKWCANPESRFPRREGKPYTVAEVMAEVMKDKPFYDKSGGGVTLTGGEVLMQLPFALRLCAALKKEGVHVAAETAGAVPKEVFQKLADAVDFVFIDCKHYDEKKHAEGTGMGNGLILENIRTLAAGKKEYCVRIPVIPGFNDAAADAEAFCKLFAALGVKNVQLLPFHQLGEKKYEKLSLPYAYGGVPQLHKEDLFGYRKIFENNGIAAAIGG